MSNVSIEDIFGADAEADFNKTKVKDSNRNYINKKGKYWLRVTKFKTDRTRKQEGFVAHEFTVVNRLTEEGHAVGEEVCTMVMRKSDYFFEDVKRLLGACLGIPANDVDYNEHMKPFYDERQIAAQLHMTLEVDVWINDKGFAKLGWKRRVPASELIDKLDDRGADLYPEGLLEAQFKKEQEKAAAA